MFFHPRYENSRANRQLLEMASTVDQVTIHDVYEAYPDFNIDVQREQELLMVHDVILWQHPLYWYSCPPMMKQWMDLVLEYGWAYGKDGHQLKGKWVTNVFSSGGSFEAYQPEGRNQFTYRALMAPFMQTAKLCQMEYLPPFIVPGANKAEGDFFEAMAIKYAEVLHFLKQGNIDLASLKSVAYFNDIIQEQWQETFYKTR